MISKAQAKFIKSLQLKKHRKVEKAFVVEGKKSVLEVLNSKYTVKLLLGTTSFFDENPITESIMCEEVSMTDLGKIGAFRSNDSALAVVEIPNDPSLQMDQNAYTLVLDSINDPGNLGTLLRIADWYGIVNIVASLDTTDLYNPKVIAASKGSFTRINVFYQDLKEFLGNIDRPVYSADMEGENVHDVNFEKAGVLILGNEANGINPALQKFVTHQITIPKYGGAESLNVAMATAIIVDNIKRS